MNLESMFLPDEAGDAEFTVGLRFGDESFLLRIANRSLELERGEAEDADAMIDTDPMTFIGVLYHGAELHAAEAAGALRIEGDRDVVTQLPHMFELPEPVELEPVGT